MDEISTRVFLVGCPRSGTTLLQCLLASNSCVASFPETHFFERVVSGRRVVQALGLAARRARKHWKDFLEEIGHPELQHVLPPYAIFLGQYSRAFVSTLDKLALDSGKPVWLEKTPGHLRRIDQITQFVKGARFVHIVRNGEDTIASMFEVGEKYADNWSTWYGTLDQCIQRWVTDVRISKQHVGQENHRVVSYDRLLADPRAVIADLCDFMHVPFEETMLSDYGKTADRLVQNWEAWKSGVHEPIWHVEKRRFLEYLNEEQRQYLRANLPKDVLDFASPPAAS